MDLKKITEIKNNSQAAANLLNDKAFQDAFEAVEKAYVDKMLESARKDTDEREYYHICYLALKDVKNILTQYVQRGKILEGQMKRNAKRNKR